MSDKNPFEAILADIRALQVLREELNVIDKDEEKFQERLAKDGAESFSQEEVSSWLVK